MITVREDKLSGKNTFIVHGDSEVLKRRAVQQIVQQRLTDDDREYGLTEIQVRDVKIEDIVNSLASGSLFATEQVVVLRDLDDMPKLQQQRLIPPLQNISPCVTVIMTASPLARSFSKTPNLSAPLVKLVKKSGGIIACSTPSHYPNNDLLSPWVADEGQRYDKQFAPGAIEQLITTVGADCDRLANETEKLAIYVGDEPYITPADIQAAASVTEEESVFDLTDAIGNRNAAAALAALPILLPVHAPQGAGIRILAMIARHLRIVWQARLLLNDGASLMSAKQCPEDLMQRLPKQHNIFQAVRGNKFLISKFSQQARRFSDGQLAKALIEVYNADLALKGQTDWQMDDRMLLETLVITLCRL